MYIFKKIKNDENHFDKSDITFEVDTSSLTDLVEEFECFLKACGFILDGRRLDLISEEEMQLEHQKGEDDEI